MSNDYIITVDENGEPYIAHWFGLGHKESSNNRKYIAKIATPKGIRYFYTKADLDAYYLRQRVKNMLSRKKNSQAHTARLTSHQKNVTAPASSKIFKRGSGLDYSKPVTNSYS